MTRGGRGSFAAVVSGLGARGSHLRSRLHPLQRVRTGDRDVDTRVTHGVRDLRCRGTRIRTGLTSGRGGLSRAGQLLRTLHRSGTSVRRRTERLRSGTGRSRLS